MAVHPSTGRRAERPAVHPSTGSGRTEDAVEASGRTENPVRVKPVETRTLLAALLFLFFPAAFAAAPGHFFDLNTGDLRAELADAKSEGRKALMVFFEQEGCPGCRHMKENVFSAKAVQEYFRRNFVSLPLDIHGSVALKDTRGRDFTEKTYAQSLKVRATPTFIFYDLSGAEIVRIVGPLATPEEFLLLGHFVTSGAYKSRTFAQFKLDRPKLKGS